MATRTQVPGSEPKPRTGLTGHHEHVAREPGEFTLLGILNALLRHRHILLALPVLFAALILVLTILTGREAYTAHATFTPTQSTDRSGYTAGRLIGDLGLDALGGAHYESLDFYASLLRSRRVLAQAALTTYRFPSVGGRPAFEGTLLDLYAPELGDPEAQLRATVGTLRDAVTVSTVPASGIIIVETAAPRPSLAVALTDRLIELVNEFNVERQQNRMLEEQAFFEERMREAQAELGSAESALELFMQRNRLFEESPELRLEAMRLQRAVDFRQQVYTSLAQSFEQASIAAVRNTALVVIIDPPALQPDREVVVLLGRLFFAVLLGAMLAGAVVLVREFFRAQRESNPGEYEEFRRLTAQARQDLQLDRLRRRARDG